MWKDGISCDIVSTVYNIIHVVVRLDSSKPEALISFMYGLTYSDPKKEQWNFMRDLSQDVFQPWLVIDDLNFHLDGNDNSTNSWVHNKVRDSGIMDVGFEGKNYTWTNNSFGTGSKRARIDLALGNNDWFINFSQAKLLHLNFIGSDHCPIPLITDPIPRNLWRPFKVFSTWINHDSFRATMDSAWNLNVHGSPAFQLKLKQQSARLTLSQWNKMEFGDIHQNIKSIQIQLENTQSDSSSSEKISRVKALTNDLKNWYSIQTEFYKLKSRDKNISDLDNNTRYFHSLVNKRLHVNNINIICDCAGTWYSDRSDISNILTAHFKNVSTTSNPCLPDDAFDIIPAILTLKIMSF
ncbi:uncharacterized protein LOC113360170 [Papaver somniferum]|uniref:uncharacterized protein LOC113360170 n=1 Tax=Papaver somniferum TaxID=3469 RepID=UPI000E702CD5|nr:uncharacterized protein LOC113360170 [Papaver somniferum]